MMGMSDTRDCTRPYWCSKVSFRMIYREIARSWHEHGFSTIAVMSPVIGIMHDGCRTSHGLYIRARTPDELYS